MKDKNQIVFTLKSNYSVYEITYDCRKDPIKAESANGKYEIENDHRIKSMPLKIIENHQQEDGSIFIPPVLHTYMGGKSVLRSVS